MAITATLGSDYVYLTRALNLKNIDEKKLTTSQN